MDYRIEKYRIDHAAAALPQTALSPVAQQKTFPSAGDINALLIGRDSNGVSPDVAQTYLNIMRAQIRRSRPMRLAAVATTARAVASEKALALFLNRVAEGQHQTVLLSAAGQMTGPMTTRQTKDQTRRRFSSASPDKLRKYVLVKTGLQQGPAPVPAKKTAPSKTIRSSSRRF